MFVPNIQIIKGPNEWIPSHVGFYVVQDEVRNRARDLLLFQSAVQDADGNLLTKIAPAPNVQPPSTATVTTTYAYDALNRLTGKTYSDGSYPVIFSYDSSTLWGVNLGSSVGRLVYGAYGPTATVFGYDPMGRVVSQWTCTPYNCASNPFTPFALSYAYDLAGDMTRYTTVGINFGQTFDAAGRVSGLTSSLVGTQFPATIATVDSSVGYWPTGAIRKMSLGNGLTETDVYNKRMQPCQSDVNSTGAYLTNCTDAVPSGNVQDFAYGFNSGTSDNGNLASVTATGTTGALTFSRGYAYDPLNRLVTMTGSGGVCTGLTWTYDAWGNRTAQTRNSGTCFNGTAVPLANNQLSGYTYDIAGNLLNDGTHSYTYNAENRIIKVDGGTTASYQYDAWGKRIRKTASAIGNLDYIYDTSDRVLAEYQVSSGFTGFYRYYLYMGGKLTAEYHNNTTYFRHEDHLGSASVITDVNHLVYDAIEYQPYGEQVSGGTGTTHKFTGKERDAESGLDDFDARYYSSTIGRFMTPDWADSPTAVPYAHFGNPQSLNLYSYVENNPTTVGDPDGHCPPCAPYEVANSLDSMINSAVSYVGNKAITSGSPTLAATTTFAAGVMGDVGKGFTSLLRTGESVGSLPENATSAQIATAVAEEGGRVGGTILAVVAVGGSSTPATAEQGASVAGEIGQNRVTLGNGSQVDLAGKAHFEKTSGESVPTPHIKDPVYNTNPNTGATYQNGYGATRPATLGDVNAAANQAGATPPARIPPPLPATTKENQ
jgi:RHS repeat-associated protein